MKRFLILTSVLNAEGYQTWYVDADTEEEALRKYDEGGGDIYSSEVDVTSLGEPEVMGETTLDDVGDLADTPPRPWVGLTDEERSEIFNRMDWVIDFNWEYELAIEAKLKEKNT